MKKKVIVSLLMLVFILTTQPITATPPTSTVEEKTKEVEELKRELIQLESEIEQLYGEKIALQNRVEVANSRVAEANLKLERARKRVEERERILSQRIRKIYKSGNRRYLEVLLNSRTFFDFIGNLVFLPKLIEQDKEIWKKLKKERSRIEKVKNELEKERDAQRYLLAEYQKTMGELLAKRNKLNELLSQANEELRQLIEEQQKRYQESFEKAKENSYLGPVNAAVATVEPYLGQVFLTSERFPKRYKATGESYVMVASWYGPGFHGRTTSSGEIFNQEDFTCAHKTLPFGTYLAVSYGGKSIIVKVNDRGPFIPGRNLDLSRKAAEALGMLGTGVATVKVEIVEPLSQTF